MSRDTIGASIRIGTLLRQLNRHGLDASDLKINILRLINERRPDLAQLALRNHGHGKDEAETLVTGIVRIMVQSGYPGWE